MNIRRILMFNGFPRTYQRYLSLVKYSKFLAMLLFKVDRFLWEDQVYPRFTASAHSSALIHQLIIMHARLSQSTSYCFFKKCLTFGGPQHQTQ